MGTFVGPVFSSIVGTVVGNTVVDVDVEVVTSQADVGGA